MSCHQFRKNSVIRHKTDFTTTKPSKFWISSHLSCGVARDVLVEVEPLYQWYVAHWIRVFGAILANFAIWARSPTGPENASLIFSWLIM